MFVYNIKKSAETIKSPQTNSCKFFAKLSSKESGAYFLSPATPEEYWVCRDNIVNCRGRRPRRPAFKGVLSFSPPSDEGGGTERMRSDGRRDPVYDLCLHKIFV